MWYFINMCHPFIRHPNDIQSRRWCTTKSHCTSEVQNGWQAEGQPRSCWWCRQKEKPNSNERGDVPALVTCSAVNTHCKVDGDSFLPVEMQRFSRFSWLENSVDDAVTMSCSELNEIRWFHSIYFSFRSLDCFIPSKHCCDECSGTLQLNHNFAGRWNICPFHQKKLASD